MAKKAGREVATRRAQQSVISKLEEMFVELKTGRGAKPLLVRLPCGYGKTLIGEAPYVAQLYSDEWLTRGLVYTLPTRALTDHHQRTLQRDFKVVDPLAKVIALHGEEHSTGLFYADALVSTFDVFAYAYARRTRTGHHLEFPAGTIATSYVVFDEAHMFQDPYFYTHMVLNRIIRVLARVGVPCIVMTATMPERVVDTVFAGVEYDSSPNMERSLFHGETYCGELRELDHQNLSPTDYASQPELPSQVTEFGRVLMVCNTVSHAQSVYERLAQQAWPKTTMRVLLHSNLTKMERIRRERLVVSLMSRQPCAGGCSRYGQGKLAHPIPPPVYLRESRKDDEPYFELYCEACSKDEENVQRVDAIFVVATQVVEAGLDVSAKWLITEVAPLDSVIQRSGRCARFPGETGRVTILHHEKTYGPYDHNLIDRADTLLHECEPSALHNIDAYISMINDNYEALDLRRPRPDLRQYLAYYEGFGLSTFTVDWKLIDKVRVRPETYVTMVVPETTMFCYEAQELSNEEAMQRQAGYRVIGDQLSLTYEELLHALVNEEKLLFPLDSVHQMSFNLEVGAVTEDRHPKAFLTHQTGRESSILEFELVRACFGSEKPYFYLAQIQPASKSITEGTYLVNPAFYNPVLGLRKDE
ncbi:MAG: DEAD/DEAH box helicase [Nitrososphaerales archaeon]